MPGELLKPTKGTPSDTTSKSDVWAREELQEHLRELECACQDRTPGALQSIDNRREKRTVTAYQTRATRQMDAFERKWNELPKSKTL